MEIWVYGYGFPAGATVRVEALSMRRYIPELAGLDPAHIQTPWRTRQLPPLDRLSLKNRRARVARWFAGRPAPRARTARLVAAVAAASVAVAVGLGITQAATQHQLESVQASGAAITSAITAPEARIQTARTTVGGTVTVVVSDRQRAAVVTAIGMPPLASARVYQVWVISPSGARSAGLLARTPCWPPRSGPETGS